MSYIKVFQIKVIDMHVVLQTILFLCTINFYEEVLKLRLSSK